MSWRSSGFVTCAVVFLAAVALADDDITVPQGITSSFCQSLDGTPQGQSCTAPYVKFEGGDACQIYGDMDDKYPPLTKWFEGATNSCSAEAIEGAKSRTLLGRARLRGYMTGGMDDSPNDPIANPSYRPNGASSGAAEMYFAAECAVKTCGGGEASAPPPVKEEEEVTPTPPPPPPPQRRYTPPPPLPRPELPSTFMFEVCNQSNHHVLVAISSRNPISGKYETWGWPRVNAYTCVKFGPYTVGEFYYFASYRTKNLVQEYSSGIDTLSLCVEPETANFFRGSRDPCTSGERRNFNHRYAGTDFTWTINN